MSYSPHKYSLREVLEKPDSRMGMSLKEFIERELYDEHRRGLIDMNSHGCDSYDEGYDLIVEYIALMVNAFKSSRKIEVIDKTTTE
jgi:hypothetical protein